MVAPVVWCGTLYFMRIGRWSRVIQSVFSPTVGVVIDMSGVCHGVGAGI